MATKPRDPKWAALRQWHREQVSRWVSVRDLAPSAPRADDADCYVSAHSNALDEMTRLSRKHGRQETRE